MKIDSFHRSAERALSLLERELGTLFLAGAKIGSLAHGGFSERYSDIDVAVILKAPAEEAAIAPAIARAKLGPDGGRLSVFWSDAAFSCGRFPVLDRADLAEHGVWTSGSPPAISRPSLAEARDALLRIHLPYWTEAARRCAEIAPDGARKELVRCLLYPARFIHAWLTGRVASNDSAVAFTKELRPARLSMEPLERALLCRSGAGDPAELDRFASRASAQVEAAAELALAEAR